MSPYVDRGGEKEAQGGRGFTRENLASSARKNIVLVLYSNLLINQMKKKLPFGRLSTRNHHAIVNPYRGS